MKNLYVWINEKYDWVIENKKIIWAELLVYVSFGSVVICAYNHILPEKWLIVLFCSVMGFWITACLLRLSWLFYQWRKILTDPFEAE